MARVTVEDCVDKIPDLRGGSASTIERENDKDAVVALREIAENTISPDDMRERLIHSIQKQAEIDEPEAAAAPILPRELRPILGRDDPTIDVVVDTMTEEALLRGLEQLTPVAAPPPGEGAPDAPSRRQH